MKRLFSRLFASGAAPKAKNGAPRIVSHDFPRALYAIGDVHGRLDLLKALEDRIVEDAGGADENVWVVLLGDIVDRGPASAQVIEHVMTPSISGFRRLCLSGNHEEAMLAAFEGREGFNWWCRYGGLETLASYGVSISQLDPAARNWATNRAVLEAYVPRAHVQFLTSLPVAVRVPGYVLVHGGFDPALGLDAQTDTDLRWFRYRSGPLAPGREGCVVHGHTIVEQALVSEGRIAIDTGAFATGRLTAVRLSPGQVPKLIEQSGPSLQS